MKQDLETLRRLTELRYHKGQEALRNVLKQEAQLRAEIARIRSQADGVDAGSRMLMGSVGADILWSAWVGKSISQLNLQLAQVLAKKDQYLAKARREHARVQVANALSQNHKDGARRDSAQTQLAQSIEAAVFKTL